MEKHWKKSEDSFSLFAGWSTNNEGSGPYVMGDTVSYADLIVASRLIWAKAAFGVNSSEWARILSWNNGKWGQFSKLFEKYEVLA